MPLDAAKIDALEAEDEEKLDAFPLRFNSLAAMIQDHLTRALLRTEDEDIEEQSRRDQRLPMEKLATLQPALAFGTIAQLRNRIAPHYPDESAKQAEILNEVFNRSVDLIEAYKSVLHFADQRAFDSHLDLLAVDLVPSRKSRS